VTKLKKDLESRKAVVLETLPPRGPKRVKYMEFVRSMLDIELTCVAVTDMPMARVRVSPWAVGHFLENEGIETLVHFSRISRNILRTEGDLLGMWMLGIKNVLLLSGDNPQEGDYRNCSKIEDVNTTELIKLVKLLNQGTDPAGNKLNSSTGFCVGGVFNHRNEAEIERTRKKLEAGVDFLVSQPVFDPTNLEKFYNQLGNETHVLASIAMFKNARQLEYFSSVPGIEIPSKLLFSIEKGDNYVQEYSAEYALSIVEKLKTFVDGIYIVGIVRDRDFIARVAQAFRS